MFIAKFRCFCPFSFTCHDGGNARRGGPISVRARTTVSGTVRVCMYAARRVGQALARASGVVAQRGADAALSNFAKIWLSQHVEVLLTT